MEEHYDNANIVLYSFRGYSSPQGVDWTNINESYIYDTFFVGSVAGILLLVKGYELFCWQIYEERFGVYFICYCSFFDFEKSNFDCERSVFVDSKQMTIVCRICHRCFLYYSLLLLKSLPGLSRHLIKRDSLVINSSQELSWSARRGDA